MACLLVILLFVFIYALATRYVVHCRICVKERLIYRSNISSIYKIDQWHVYITYSKFAKIGINSHFVYKTLANPTFMVYACRRYPILVWRTVLFQNI